MNILFVSSTVNHHLVPTFLEVLKNPIVDGCRFAALSSLKAYRIEMGFPIYENEKWYFGVNNQTYQEFRNMFLNYDVVVCYERNLCDLMEERLRNSKLIFYFSERWWKPPFGLLRLLIDYKYVKYVYKFRRFSKYKEFHYLSQGYFAANDFTRLGICRENCWSWGYFPPIQVENYSNDINQSIRILWVGRLLGWKRIKLLIKAYHKLFVEYKGIELVIIGDGPRKKECVRLKKKYSLIKMSFMPFQKMEVIRQKMRESDIYVLPSSGYEGWGAVVNEAMSERCACVVADKCGCISMISNGNNGLLFKNGSWIDLYSKLLQLIENPTLLAQIKEEGCNTIQQFWSPEIAASRFVDVCHAILIGRDIPIYAIGPMKKC